LWAALWLLTSKLERPLVLSLDFHVRHIKRQEARIWRGLRSDMIQDWDARRVAGESGRLSLREVLAEGHGVLPLKSVLATGLLSTLHARENIFLEEGRD
jgi:hypothetical protein